MAKISNLTDKMNLWILTEENPRKETIKKIMREFASEMGLFVQDLNNLDIVPEINGDKFTFRYIVNNVQITRVSNTYIKIISGSKSFVDYLIFFQDEEPSTTDKPLFAIEETKVDINESRNVTAYQRNTKFVYLRYFFKDIKSLVIYFRDFPSDKLNKTYSLKFGIRLLLTMGIKIWGIENLKDYELEPFRSYDELIQFKNKMPDPVSGQKVIISKKNDTIEISIKLDKGSGNAKNKISHDPNVGQAASIICCLRKLGWKGKITLINHGITQKNFSTAKSKLITILHMESATLDGLEMPKEFGLPNEYWRKEVYSEKIATIFLNIVLERLDNVEAIFNNHAGCERSYLKLLDQNLRDIPKTIFVPDLVICDHNKQQILNLEGKKYENLGEGISDLENYDKIESIIKSSYYSYSITRWVVLYGGTASSIKNEKVAFLLNSNGNMVVSDNTPEIIRVAVQKVLNG